MNSTVTLDALEFLPASYWGISFLLKMNSWTVYLLWWRWNSWQTQGHAPWHWQYVLWGLFSLVKHYLHLSILKFNLRWLPYFQELLALEERIGDVSTGLSEEAVIKLLKQRKFSSWRLKASLDPEPCCICQVFHILPSFSELSCLVLLAIGISVRYTNHIEWLKYVHFVVAKYVDWAFSLAT